MQVIIEKKGSNARFWRPINWLELYSLKIIPRIWAPNVNCAIDKKSLFRRNQKFDGELPKAVNIHSVPTVARKKNY